MLQRVEIWYEYGTLVLNLALNSSDLILWQQHHGEGNCFQGIVVVDHILVVICD